jgi:hypothetical protein
MCHIQQFFFFFFFFVFLMLRTGLSRGSRGHFNIEACAQKRVEASKKSCFTCFWYIVSHVTFPNKPYALARRVHKMNIHASYILLGKVWKQTLPENRTYKFSTPFRSPGQPIPELRPSFPNHSQT